MGAITPVGDSEWLATSRATRLLTDAQIRAAVDGGALISAEFEPDSARYASYELHASADVKRLDYVEAEDGSCVTTSVDHPVLDGHIRLDAGVTVRVFSKEAVFTPSDVVALVFGLGQLFGSGLSIGCTYVDPGTKAAIYLSITNVGDRTVYLPVGAPMGRVFFLVLGAPVEREHTGERRRIQLKAGPAPAGRGPETNQSPLAGGSLERPIVAARFRLALWALALLYVGLLWQDRAASWLLGDEGSATARLFLPLVVGVILSSLSRRFRRNTLEPVARDTIQRVAQRLRSITG